MEAEAGLKGHCGRQPPPGAAGQVQQGPGLTLSDRSGLLEWGHGTAVGWLGTGNVPLGTRLAQSVPRFPRTR